MVTRPPAATAGGSGEFGSALFDTAIGTCAVVWGDRGVRALLLPDTTPAQLRSRVGEAYPAAVERTPSPAVRRLVRDVTALLGGRAVDLTGHVIDLDGSPEFHRRVYEVARSIPPGETRTYGQVAALAGRPGAARAVGQALARNPVAVVVPCHRVVAAVGKAGGFSAPGGTETKLRMLAIEGVSLPAGRDPTPSRTRLSAESIATIDADAVLARLRRRDRELGLLIAAAGPFAMALEPATSTYASLAEAIVYQQLSPKAAATIFGRVRALFPGTRALRPADVAAASDDELRAAGLSGAKTRALRDLTARALDGSLPTLATARRLDDDELVARLVQVRGVGRWTAEMFLMFGLGRPDVLPSDDYGLRRGFGLAFCGGALPDRGQVEERGERWRPYRTVASWYLWRAAEGILGDR